MLIYMHEASRFSITELRQLMRPKKLRQRANLSPAVRLEKLDRLKQAAAYGGQCLADAYVNRCTLIRFKCRMHGVFEAQARHILNGQWCPRCARSKPQPARRKMAHVNADAHAAV